MKIKGNRFVSSFLSCVMIFSLCTPAFASEESPQLDKTAIYSQLEKQGALDMYDIHEAIYTATTPSIIPFGSDDEYTNVYAPDGGTLEYILNVFVKPETACRCFWLYLFRHYRSNPSNPCRI